MSAPLDGNMDRTHAELYGTEEPSERTGPLVGFRVLDFTQFQAGPAAAVLLADYGADVCKIEPPGMGDPIRESAFPGYLDSFAPQFFNFNRGKRSIQLDLRREGAKEIIFRMVKSADVVLENFKVGTMDRLGIGYDVLKEQNPDIIYASASGFGLQGPWKDRGSYDTICQAVSGVAVSQAGGPSQRPVRVGTSASSDTMSGVMCAFAVVSALLAREKQGIAQRVDSPQLGAMLTLESLGFTDYMQRQDADRVMSSDRARQTRDDGVLSGHHWATQLCDYQCSDGRWVATGAVSPKQWLAFCNAIDRDDLGEKYAPVATRAKEYLACKEEMIAAVAQVDSRTLVRRMAENDCPCGLHNSYEDLLDEEDDTGIVEQLRANGLVQEAFGRRHFGVAANFSETKAKVQGPPPQVGQHTREILREAGLTESEIEVALEAQIVEERGVDEPIKIGLRPSL